MSADEICPACGQDTCGRKRQIDDEYGRIQGPCLAKPPGQVKPRNAPPPPPPLLPPIMAIWQPLIEEAKLAQAAIDSLQAAHRAAAKTKAPVRQPLKLKFPEPVDPKALIGLHSDCWCAEMPKGTSPIRCGACRLASPKSG